MRRNVSIIVVLSRYVAETAMLSTKSTRAQVLPGHTAVRHCKIVATVGPSSSDEATFRAMDAENSLLFATDYPHWDMDLPGVIWDLPFLSETAKRKILGLNAQKVFKLDVSERFPRAEAAE